VHATSCYSLLGLPSPCRPGRTVGVDVPSARFSFLAAVRCRHGCGACALCLQATDGEERERFQDFHDPVRTIIQEVRSRGRAAAWLNALLDDVLDFIFPPSSS
jgi:hypothetical protein